MEPSFYPGADIPDAYKVTCMLWSYAPSTVLGLKLFKKLYGECQQCEAHRADFGREMHGDMKFPFNGVNNYGAIWRTGARTWGLECDAKLDTLATTCDSNSQKRIPLRINKIDLKSEAFHW